MIRFIKEVWEDDKVIFFLLVLLIALGIATVIFAILASNGTISSNDSFNVSMWVSNPSNPASPLH